MAMLRTQNIKVVRSVLSTMLFSFVEVPIFPRRVLKVYSHHILFRSFSYPNLFGKKALMLLLLEQYLWLFPIGTISYLGAFRVRRGSFRFTLFRIDLPIFEL
jgi:hypothetical protein